MAKTAAVGWAAAVLATVVALAGCGSTSGTSTEAPGPATGPDGISIAPAAQNPIPLNQLWDPRSLTDPAIFAPLKLDPSFGHECDDTPPNTRSCQWESNVPLLQDTPYAAYVYSSKESLNEVLHDKRLSHFVETTVAGHRAVRYQVDNYGPRERCELAWGTSWGSVWVTIQSPDKVLLPGGVDTCGGLPKWAASVYPHVPR